MNLTKACFNFHFVYLKKRRVCFMTSFSKNLFHKFGQILNNADRLKNQMHFLVYENFDFSRKSRKLPIREELLDYFDYSNAPPLLLLLCSKINPGAFRFLFVQLNIAYPTTSTYIDYKLIAIVGSELQIPVALNDVDTLHACGSKDKYISCYHINASHDILNNRFKDMIFQGCPSKHEVEAMWTMVESFHDCKAIFMADRNYPNHSDKY